MKAALVSDKLLANEITMNSIYFMHTSVFKCKYSAKSGVMVAHTLSSVIGRAFLIFKFVSPSKDLVSM